MESTNLRFTRHRLLPPRLFIWLLIWRPTPTMGIYARYATYYTTFGCSFGDWFGPTNQESTLAMLRTTATILPSTILPSCSFGCSFGDHGKSTLATLPTTLQTVNLVVHLFGDRFCDLQLQLHTYGPTDCLPILRLSGRASHSEMVDPTSLTVGKAIHSSEAVHWNHTVRWLLPVKLWGMPCICNLSIF